MRDADPGNDIFIYAPNLKIKKNNELINYFFDRFLRYPTKKNYAPKIRFTKIETRFNL
jgi:hypothetical protein